MDAIKLFALLFLISPSVFAANLCDESCELIINFPEGGSIEATEPLTFTFGTEGSLVLGETGTINTAIQPINTDYSSGGTLTLATGESITFDVNGSLIIGSIGNLEYTSISIEGPFTADVTATGGTESIKLDHFSISGEATFNLDALIIEIGNLVSDSNLSIIGSDKSNQFILGSNEALSSNVDSSTGINITGSLSLINISGGAGNDSFNITGNSLSQSNTTPLYDYSNTSAGISLTSWSIETTASSNLNCCYHVDLNNEDIFTLSSSDMIDLNTLGSLSISDSFYENPTVLLGTTLFDNIEDLNWFVEGQSCSLSLIDEVIHCETEDGKRYKFIDGEWTEADSAGLINLLTLLLLSFSVLVFRQKYSY